MTVTELYLGSGEWEKKGFEKREISYLGWEEIFQKEKKNSEVKKFGEKGAKRGYIIF